MQNENYPDLYQASDAASLSAQNHYLCQQRIYLVSLILVSIIGTTTALVTDVLRVWLYTAMAIILTLGLLILWVTRSRRDDKAWFDCRAIAESVKTVSWRFMMKAVPFEQNDSVEELFVAKLREIREARPDSARFLTRNIDAKAPVITDFMRQVRLYSFDERKQFYIDERLHEQKLWYSNKAKINTLIGTRWFWLSFCLQVISITVAVIQAAICSSRFNVIPVLTTFTAAVAGWIQIKRYDELAKSYALAAQELGELEVIANNLTRENDFPQLVEQVEEAISREHIMWCARRDMTL